MIPIEVTHTVLSNPGVVERIRALDSVFSCKIIQLLAFFASTYKEVFKMHEPPVHDPVAIAFVISPGLFRTELMRVDIEVGSVLCAGQTVCDVWHMSKQSRNANVALSLDAAMCWELILDAIVAADTTSPLNLVLPDPSRSEL
jgi:purine nucleosidase/pyrimidine-specific ribonucleoside hydrolase